MSQNSPLMQQPRHSRPIYEQASSAPDVCFGILCPSHSKCQRYEAVNGSDPAGARMNSCKTGAEWPMFVLRKA